MCTVYLRTADTVMPFDLRWIKNKKRGTKDPVIGYVHDRAAPGQHRDAPCWSNRRIHNPYLGPWAYWGRFNATLLVPIYDW